MKLDITEAQLRAIAEACQSLETTLGGGGDIESKDYGLDNYDKDTKKQLRLIGKFFTNNGYLKPTEL